MKSCAGAELEKADLYDTAYMFTCNFLTLCLQHELHFRVKQTFNLLARGF